MPLFRRGVRGSPGQSPPRAHLHLEELESRLVPYSTTGNLWPSQQLITVSFVPDGTVMSSGSGGTLSSDMFAKFNAQWSTSVWQAEILKAAQVWAQAANINFAVISDNGTDSGGGSYQQGDSGMGDVRIGTYTMQSNYLGMAAMPPAINNYSVAGDFAFNSARTYNINTTYDLQTVAMHEFGHALGLGHGSLGLPVMFSNYIGLKRVLTADDVAGIQAIYGARQADLYDAVIPNNSFLTASVVTPLLDLSTLTGQLNNLDITSTSDQDYFAVVAPVGSTQLTINVQSSGLSLLRPALTVYAADMMTVLGSATGTGFEGSTLSVSLSGVDPLSVYYVKVTGADSTAFGTGRYSLSLSLGTEAVPGVSLPITQLLNGEEISSGGGLPQKDNEGSQSEGFHAFTTDGHNHDDHDGHDDEGHGRAGRGGLRDPSFFRFLVGVPGGFGTQASGAVSTSFSSSMLSFVSLSGNARAFGQLDFTNSSSRASTAKASAEKDTLFERWDEWLLMRPDSSEREEADSPEDSSGEEPEAPTEDSGAAVADDAAADA